MTEDKLLEYHFYMALAGKDNRRYVIPSYIPKKQIIGMEDTVNIMLNENNFKKMEGAEQFDGLNYQQVIDKMNEIQEDDDEFFDALDHISDDEEIYDDKIDSSKW